MRLVVSEQFLVLALTGLVACDNPLSTRGHALAALTVVGTVHDTAGVPAQATITYFQVIADGHSYPSLADESYAVTDVQGTFRQRIEPPRDCRRLQSLRGWSHVTSHTVFSRST